MSVQRFYFDLQYDDGLWSDDPDGTELPSRDQGRIEALELAASIAKEQARAHHKIAIRARDDAGAHVVTVTLSVELQPPD